jgi:formylmethanofuran dehydrogenase subunit E
MAGKARIRFIQRSNRLQFDRETGHYNGETIYGVDCLYCNEYFPNARKPDWGGYVCKGCK